MGSLMPRSTGQILQEAQRIGVQFLLADLATGMTFLDLSEVTRLEESRSRNRRNARCVYDTVMRLLPRICPSDCESAALSDRLAELKRRLIAIGYLDDSRN
jgi:hypothetical protein